MHDFFRIVAFVLFPAIRMINKLKKEEEAKPASNEVSADVKLLTEIRDLLARWRYSGRTDLMILQARIPEATLKKRKALF